jgi:hypothetical protein
MFGIIGESFMIITFCQDDWQLVALAYRQGEIQEDIFGIPYCYLPEAPNLPNAEIDENIFVSAHGNAYEIGNRGKGLGLSPYKLADYLYDWIFPKGYKGGVYISACDSAPQYVNNMKEFFVGQNLAVDVYGMIGSIPKLIARPDNDDWVAGVWPPKKV